MAIDNVLTHQIASAGHTDVVKLLLEKGADPSFENETKQSAL